MEVKMIKETHLMWITCFETVCITCRLFHMEQVKF